MRSFFALLFNSPNAFPRWLAHWQFRGMVASFANATLTITLALVLLFSAGSAYAATATVLPNAKGSGDNSSEQLSEITAQDATLNPNNTEVNGGGNGAYSLLSADDGENILQIDSFDTSAVSGIISAVTLHVRYGAHNRWDANNQVQWRFQGVSGWTNTGLSPTAGGGWQQGSYDLFAQGVDTIAEIQALDVRFNNTSRDGRGVVHFDYLWLEVTYTAANSAATLVVNQPDGAADTIAEGGSFTVNYDLSDSDDVTTVSFFYETDGNGAGGTAIAGCTTQPEATGGTCVWNTTGVAPGSYFVYGTTSGDGAGAATVVSSGTMTINDAPALIVSEPNGTGDTVTAGDVYNITYTLNDGDDTVTAAFFYDNDNLGLNGTAITGACATAAEGTGVTCAWNTTGVPPGNYFVYGISTTDAVNSAAQAYSPGMITIGTPNSAATLVVNQPDGVGDMIAEGGSFTVNYDLADSDDVTTVSFFYETDGNGAGGTAIAGCGTQPEVTGGTCVWDTSGVAPGSYFVYGTTSGDGAGAATVVSSGTMTINGAATLVVNQPDGVGDTIAEGGSFTVNYNLADSDDVTTVSFFYETDGNGAGGTAIAGCAIQPEATGGTCVWNTSGVAPGSYFVYGTTSGDGAGAATVVSSGTVTINDAPVLSISEPNGTGDTVTVGSAYNVTYTLTDSDNTVTAAFFYDTDNLGFNGTAITGACATAAEGAGVTCAWNTTGVPPGSYYVYGISTTDGFNNPSQAYSPGVITISSNSVATLVVNQPDGVGDTIAEGGSFTVNYNLSDSDDVTTVSFFYETDGNGAGGTAIAGCGNQPEATGGTCAWNTSGVAPGSYFVYGTTSGDGAGATTVVSSGTMTINDAPALSISEPNGAGDTVTVGNVYNITYTLTDGNDTITAAFFYDTNAVGFNGTAISGCGSAPEGSGVTCAWNTTGMTPGDYYVYGISTTDAFSGAAQAYSPGVITIVPNVAATLIVNQPDGVGDTIAEGGSFTVNYDLSDSDDVTTVSFFYETDGNGAGGTAIAGCGTQPEATGGTCVWNTSGLAPGSYFVYGTTGGDGAGTATVVSSGTVTINGAATLVVNQPDGTADTIAEGGSFTVNYDLSDSDDVTTVAFFYDTNNSGADGTAITGCAAEPEATGGTCVWNTSGVAPGNYYVYGTTSGDGAGSTTVYSAGTMIINDAPALSISEPNGTGDTVGAGGVYNITYTLTDSDDTITVAFYYDSDAVGFNGTAISGACAAAAEGSGLTCGWDTSGMTPGNYYIYGISTTDAFNSAARAYSPGVITINANSVASLIVNQPDGVGDTITGGDSFTISYNLSDSDDVTTVSFFYDTNNSGTDGTAIAGCAAQPEATGGTCVWDTSSVAPGAYFVYGRTSGDGAGATTVYSPGAITINVAPLRYASGDDGTNLRSGDSIAGISRIDGGPDHNNRQSTKWKINVEWEFKIDFIDDSGESPLVEPMLYIAHRDAPTEGAGGDFFAYPLACTGAAWGTGKTCTTTMKLGPAASHKFYFYAEKTDGTVLRKPSTGYTDGPEIQLINGYSLVGVSRDIDSSNHDGFAAFNSGISYGWVSAGLDTDFSVTFNGDYVPVTSANPAETGRGYYVYKSSGTLPELGFNGDVTAASHTITLQAGWNAISNPYNGNVKLDDVQIRRNAGTTNTWSNAAAQNWIEPAVYYYMGSDWGGTSASEFGPGAELVPWMGYFMYVKDDINSYELIITKPAQ